MKILLVIPPFTQLNTPYPSIPFITNWLRHAGHDVRQIDLGIYTIRRIFCRTFIQYLEKNLSGKDEMSRLFLSQSGRWKAIIEPAMAYLDGHYPEFEIFAAKGHLPETIRERDSSDLLALEDCPGGKTRFQITLLLEELAVIINRNIDSNFSLVRYDNALAPSLSQFSSVINQVKKISPISTIFLDELTRILSEETYDMAGFTIPFPGTLTAAFQCMQKIRELCPQTDIFAGGGYVSTELRDITSLLFFDYCDYLIFDSGEAPLKKLIAHLSGECEKSDLLRCAVRENNEIVFFNMDAKDRDFTHYAPDYSGLDLQAYLSLYDTPNDALRLWADGRWMKLAAAYGCYWAKCAFCDGSLDYIGSYIPFDPLLTVDRMDALAASGHQAFHFVDEAAPPAIMMKIALELLRRGRRYTWWTNIRFEKSFSAGMCRLLSLSGLIAVSGGIEIAEDSGLQAICKGITLKEIAKVTNNFSKNGILVHAYLIHGFPGESDQQTLDSLEAVRQLFKNGCLDSGYWHRFALTVHSPFYKTMKDKGRISQDASFDFARNDIFDDTLRAPYADNLRKALYNFMHGSLLDEAAENWLGINLRPSLKRNAVQEMIQTEETVRYVLWIGGKPFFYPPASGKAIGLCSIEAPDTLLKIEMNTEQFRELENLYVKEFADYSCMPIIRYSEIMKNNINNFLNKILGFLENTAILFI